MPTTLSPPVDLQGATHVPTLEELSRLEEAASAARMQEVIHGTLHRCNGHCRLLMEAEEATKRRDDAFMQYWTHRTTEQDWAEWDK